MSKELDYIQRHIDIVKQQIKGSKVKFIVTDTVTNHQYDYYERELQTLESIEQALQRLETIDNSNPSEALEELKRIDYNITYLLSDCDINEEVSMNFNSIRDNKSCNIIKQALLKAQEPKHYLKWEDLEFKEKRQTIKVRMGNTIYDLFFYEFDTGYKRCHLCNEEETLIYDIQEQFFNDLHLERVEE